MTQDITPRRFDFQASGSPIKNHVHTVTVGGEPHFVANDVAAALGYSRPRKAVSDHCKGGTVLVLPSRGGPQEQTVIPEADVYRLIMRSKLPAAEQFADWVMEAVLPCESTAATSSGRRQ